MGLVALDWPGLDHQLIATASLDGTARVWDPRDPSRELAHLALFGHGYSIAALNRTTLAVASTRGFLVFEFRTDLNFLPTLT